MLIDWLRVRKGEAICAGGVCGARPDRELLDVAAHLALYLRWPEFGCCR
jgi:hypothetical protein